MIHGSIGFIGQELSVVFFSEFLLALYPHAEYVPARDADLSHVGVFVPAAGGEGAAAGVSGEVEATAEAQGATAKGISTGGDHPVIRLRD